MAETTGSNLAAEFKKILAQYDQRRNEPPTKVAAPSRLELILAMQATRLRSEKVEQKNPGGTMVAQKMTYCGIEKRCSKADVARLTSITLSDMMVNKTHKGRYLLVRSICPAYSLTGVTLAIEDVTGRVELITLYNYPLHGVKSGADLDVLFPVGTILLIREPVYKRAEANEGCLVRVDSPTDVVRLLDGHDPLLEGLVWATGRFKEPPKVDHRATGNEFFKRGKFRLAVELYSAGIKDRIADVHELALLHLNRAAAQLGLSNFASAYHDTESVLEYLHPEEKHLREKAFIRRARALEGMRSFSAAIAAYRATLDEWPENAEAVTGLAKMQTLLEQSTSGTFDWAELIKIGNSASAKLDVADFRGPIKVVKLAARGGGRGIVTTRDVKAGEVLVVEKAFGVAYSVKDETPTLAFDLHRGELRHLPDLALIDVITAKLLDNPQLANSFYSLYAGPSYPAPSLPMRPFGAEPEPPTRARCFIDSGKIEQIINFNRFGLSNVLGKAPTESDSDRPSALFVLSSLFNHACAPNALWNTFGDVMVIRARCPIAEGDEVFIRYINPTNGDRPRALKKWLPNGCTCDLCGYDKLEGAANLLRRKQELARLPDLIRLEKSIRPGKHADTARQIQKTIDTIQSTVALFANPLAPPLDQIVAADIAAMESVGARFIVTESRTSNNKLPAQKRQPVTASPATTTVAITAAPFDSINEGVLALASVASTYHRLKKSSEALVWLRAAIEMSTMVYGGGQDAFVARFAAEVKALGPDGWEGIMSQL